MNSAVRGRLIADAVFRRNNGYSSGLVFRPNRE